MGDIILPDIMNETPLIGGKIEEQFGQQLENFGNNLLRIYNAQQQSLLDVETARQVIQAKSLALATVDEFNKGLDTNIDYTNYGEAWNSQKAALQDQLANVLKLPSAQQAFAEWWVPAQSKQTEYVYGQVRQKTVASAQATANVAIDQLTSQGDEQGVYDMVKYGVVHGLFSASEASTVAKSKIPEARYNGAIRDLSKMENPTAAAALLASGADYGLDPKQQKDAIEYFQSQAEQQTKLQKSIQKEDGLKYWDEYLQKKVKGFDSLADMNRYSILVDDGHRETIRRDIEAYKKDLPNQIGFAQDALKDTIVSQIWEWATNAPADSKAPIAEDTLTAMTAAVGDKPAQLRDDNVATIKKALAEAAVTRDDKEVSGMYSRLYGAVDSGRNPAIELTIKEIDQTIQDSGKHQAVLAKRNELQKEYETGRGATKEDVFYEAYRIANDPYMKEEAKNKWIDEHVVAGGGLSPDDGMKVRGWIKPYNDNPKRKQAMDAIGKAYQISMANPNLNTTESKRLASELYSAQNTMDAMFRNPKTTDANIDDAVSSFLTGKAMQDIMNVLSGATGGAGFPADTGKAGRARELETARELGVLGQFPKTGAEFATTYRPIALQQEKNALDRAKIAFTSQAQNALGDMEYATASGDKYVVRQLKVAGVMVERVYKALYRTANGKTQIGYQLVPGQ